MLCDKSSQKGFLEVLFIMSISVHATAVQDNKVGCHHCTVPGTCTLTSEGVISSTDDCYAKCERRADCLGIQYDNGTRDCNIFFSSFAGNCNGIVYNAGDVYVYRKSDRTDCSVLSLSHFWGMYTSMHVQKINPSTKESCLEECFERDGCFDLSFVQMSGDCFIYDDCTGCSEMNVPGFDSYRYLCIEGSLTSTPTVTTLSSTALTVTPGTLTITSSGKGTSIAPTTTAGRLIITPAATGITSTTTETPGLLTSTAPVTGTIPAPTATFSTITTSRTGMTQAPTTTAGLVITTATGTRVSPATTATTGLLTSTAPDTATPPLPTATFSTITTSGTGITLAPTTTAGTLITSVPETTMSPAPSTVMKIAPTATPGFITSTAPGTGMTPAPTATPGTLTSTAYVTGITLTPTATPGSLTCTATTTRTLTPALTAIVSPHTSIAYDTGTSVSTSALSGLVTSMQSVSLLSSTFKTTAAVSAAPVLGNNSATSTSKPIYIWPCLCSSNSFSGLSQDRIIEQLVNDVKIDTSQTSLSLSKKKCIDDFRVSAKSIGIIAAAMMATCGGVFILLDVLGWISGHAC